MTSTTRLAIAALTLAGARIAGAIQLPSCESDTEAHCLGDGSDMSPEGIQACLAKLGSDRSELCSAYLALIEGCKADTAPGGVCGDAHANGETMPCLIQRVKPEQLSASCSAALPKKVMGTGLMDKYWADGKRELEDDEVAALNEDDRDTYDRYIKRKHGKKSSKDKDRDYAVKKQKRAKSTAFITEMATQAAIKYMEKEEDGEKLRARVLDVVQELADQEIKADKTKTLTSFTRGELSTMANKAVQDARKAGKQEL